MAASTEQSVGLEEETFGYAKAPSYVVNCDKCCETEIRPQKLKRLFL